MKKICRSHTVSLYTSKQLDEYFKGMRVGIFDIETLGLNPSIAPMVLAGIVTFEGNNQCVVTQYFAETPEEEHLVLNCLKEDFKEIDYLLTFNGKHFDIPFIAKRASVNNIKGIETSLYNLDIYLILNGHSEIKHILTNLKQKTVEEYMGLSSSRDDSISGAESILLYEAYLQCKDPVAKKEFEDKILLHNHDDLLQLAKLLPILKQVNIHKAFYGLGIPVLGQSGWPTFNVASVKRTNTSLNIIGSYYGEPFSYVSYEGFTTPFSCEFKEDKTFKFTLRTDKHKGNTFINLPSYFENYDNFKKYPNYIKNFLLISNSNSTNHLELNFFAKKFLENFMENTVCPLMVL